MHYDADERLADMDADGIAAEVIYHGATNAMSYPWRGASWSSHRDTNYPMGFGVGG